MFIPRKYKNLVFFVLLHSPMYIRAIPLINEIVLKDNTIIVRPNELFKKRYLKDDFFACYSKDDVDVTTLNQSTLITPFLMNVIPIIWLSNETWEIDEIDEALYESLQVLKKIFAYVGPETSWNGTLKVHKKVRNVIGSTQPYTFVMPFSGGLDSVHTSISYSDTHQILVTLREHAGFVNNVQWDAAKKNAIHFAQKFGHENVFVESNYQRFIKKSRIFDNTQKLGAATSHGLGWLGIVVPILVAKKCVNFKIASSISWNYPSSSVLCPMVDEAIKFANIAVLHDGFDYSRPDKMYMVSQFFKKTQQQCLLYVCQKSSDGTNCCACEKCVRTICALLAIGETSLNEYGFNICLDDLQPLIEKVALEWKNDKFWRLEDIQSKIAEKNTASTMPLCAWLSSLNPDRKKKEFDFHELAAFVAKLTLS